MSGLHSIDPSSLSRQQDLFGWWLPAWPHHGAEVMRKTEESRPRMPRGDQLSRQVRAWQQISLAPSSFH